MFRPKILFYIDIFQKVLIKSSFTRPLTSVCKHTHFVMEDQRVSVLRNAIINTLVDA